MTRPFFDPLAAASRAALAAGVLFAASAPAPAPAQERREIPDFRVFGAADAATTADLEAFTAAFRSAWADQDVDALMALHSPDVEWINAYGRLIREAAPLEDFLATRLFPAFDPAVSRQEAENMRLISIRHLGESAAVAHLYTEGGRGESRNEGEPLRRTHIHFVLAKQAGAWAIVHAAIMDVR